MEKITITKEHFLEYLRWQRIGRFNMLDYNSWNLIQVFPAAPGSRLYIIIRITTKKFMS